jgi:hypothetical protein
MFLVFTNGGLSTGDTQVLANRYESLSHSKAAFLDVYWNTCTAQSRIHQLMGTNLGTVLPATHSQAACFLNCFFWP